jgi:hypothetical protein
VAQQRRSSACSIASRGFQSIHTSTTLTTKSTRISLPFRHSIVTHLWIFAITSKLDLHQKVRQACHSFSERIFYTSSNSAAQFLHTSGLSFGVIFFSSSLYIVIHHYNWMPAVLSHWLSAPWVPVHISLRFRKTGSQIRCHILTTYHEPDSGYWQASVQTPH